MAKKTTKASKKTTKKPAAKKAPAKKPAAKPAPKKAAKAAAPKKPAASVAKKPASKPGAKVAKKAATKAPAKKVATAAKKSQVEKALPKPATKPAPKPAQKPVKASIAEGSAPLVTLTPAEPVQKASPSNRDQKKAGGSLRYVNDAESDQTRGSVDELDSLDVIEADEDAGDTESNEFDAGDAAAEASGRDEMSDRDTLAAGPEGDEPLLTTEERAARKIEHTPETTRAFAIAVARALADDKCTDLVVLDVRNLSSLSDYIVVGSGTSDRQMHFAIKNAVEMASKDGHQVARTSSDDRKTWLIADFVDVIIHLFEPNTRAHYDIEMLWGDAPRLEWERPDQMSRDRAGLGAN